MRVEGRKHVPWNPGFRLVLASNSTTRRGLLVNAGIPFDVDAARIDERAVEAEFFDAGGAVRALSSTLARAKAVEVSQRNPGAFCLGADQVLTMGDRVFHKAERTDEARVNLTLLAGRTHQLSSAFAVAVDGECVHADEDSALLTMRPLDTHQIDGYLETVGAIALSTVGGYQLEGFGIHLFDRIDGDHTTILGLPLLKLTCWLRRQGALLI